MGGGDLNLKKSWHPSTLRNIERVWKAEQKHEAEKQKIEQLQKELAEERAREEIQAFAEDQGVVKRKGERLDWMYQGPAALVNREEYLLGRKVDKTFELLQQQESGNDTGKDEEKQLGALFSQSSVNTTVDLANKIREDPLFSIMKKEKEERKTLLNNPVKIKQLQQLLKKSLSTEKKKKKKKSKRKHKRTRHETDSSGSSSDSEDSSKNAKRPKKGHSLKQNNSLNSEEILNYNTKKEKQFFENEEKYAFKTYQNGNRSSDHHSGTVHHNKKLSEFSKTSDQDYSTRDATGGTNYSRHKSTSKSIQNYDYNLQSSSDRRNYHDLDNSSKHKQHHDQSSRESTDKRKYGSSDNSLKRKQSDDYNSSRTTKRHYDGYRNGERKEEERKLSNEEKDKLRQEMLDNAKWREEQRQRNVQRYKKEDERENMDKKDDAPDFIKPILSKAASGGSLENRIRQKIFSIQRNKHDMERNFARR